MTNFLQTSLVIAALAASTSAVMAQSRGEGGEVYAQSYQESVAPTRARTRVIARGPVHNSMNDVYDGSHYVGADPSAQIRNELRRDTELFTNH